MHGCLVVLLACGLARRRECMVELAFVPGPIGALAASHCTTCGPLKARRDMQGGSRVDAGPAWVMQR